MTDRNEAEASDVMSEASGTEDQAEKLLGPLAEDMHDYAIFGLDADGFVSSWNAGARRMKGYRSDEIIGRHFTTFYPRDQIESGHPQWELAQAAANGFCIDHGWRVRKDGTRFWAHVVITAQRSTDGRLDGFVKVTRDNTEVHARQRRSARRFSDLFRMAPVAIALFDDDGLLLDANGTLRDLLDYRLYELVGKRSNDLLHPDEKAEDLFPARSLPAHKSVEEPPGPAHRLLLRSDGEPLLCEVRCAPSVQDDGTRFWLAGLEDVTEQVARANNLYYQTTHDADTELLNRKGVTELLTQLLEERNPFEIGVLFCDLDNFKRVNDSLGHEAGDELLVMIARRLTNELPQACTPARLYGDEFLIVCSDLASCDGMTVLTSRVLEILRTVLSVRGNLINVSASIGTATADDPEISGEELVRRADRARFVAKAQGHGSALRARRSLSSSISAQLTLEQELRQAILHGHLTLHYQPVVDGERSIVLAEALVRWPHPERGMLAPDVILSVAEQGGLEIELDRWVLRTALREAASWPVNGTRPVGIAVNLSGLRPTLQSFSEEVSSAIADSGIASERVVLEMVETILVNVSERPSRTMRELAATGLRFAMDDFGTGYSSLARLKDLPTQIVKLDRRFVSGMGSDPSDLGIARAVVELARAMGRTCIAEGVETATQYRLLHGLGVDAYQGYLFAAPLPVHEFRELLSRSPLPLPDG
ncbi:putative bifunctional diguanylate cyclase/phosphodiesterase [Parasphingorhabdus pacifica]